MHSLKDKVSYCLTKYQTARNSDKKLINAVYVEYYNSHLFKVDAYEDGVSDNMTQVYAIKLNELYNLPNPSHIIRWRQKLNEQGLLRPTDENVIKARKLEEVKWHNEFSHSNPSMG